MGQHRVSLAEWEQYTIGHEQGRADRRTTHIFRRKKSLVLQRKGVLALIQLGVALGIGVMASFVSIPHEMKVAVIWFTLGLEGAVIYHDL